MSNVYFCDVLVNMIYYGGQKKIKEGYNVFFYGSGINNDTNHIGNYNISYIKIDLLQNYYYALYDPWSMTIVVFKSLSKNKTGIPDLKFYGDITDKKDLFLYSNPQSVIYYKVLGNLKISRKSQMDNVFIECNKHISVGPDEVVGVWILLKPLRSWDTLPVRFSSTIEVRYD